MLKIMRLILICDDLRVYDKRLLGKWFVFGYLFCVVFDEMNENLLIFNEMKNILLFQ